MLHRLIRSWQVLRAELGLPMACLYAAHVLLERVSGSRARIVPYAFVAQPIGSDALARVRDDPQTVVHIAAPVSALATHSRLSPDVIRQRFESGATCYVASVKGRFAGFIWTCRHSYQEDEVRCHYRLADIQHTIWDFDVYVVPDYRFGRTMARMWKAVDQELRREHIRWSISRISLFNAGSLNSHIRLGARRLGTGVFFVCGPLQVALFTLRPFFDIGVGKGSIPVLTLSAPKPHPGTGVEDTAPKPPERGSACP